MSCEDFPCCGHESGCCPNFDPETGRQLDMKCVCGVSVPLSSRSSLCPDCLRGPSEEFYGEDDGYADFYGEDDGY